MEECSPCEDQSDSLEWWNAKTAVEGQTYKHQHKRYGEVTVVAVRTPMRPSCVARMLCRCGCGERGREKVKYDGYTAACFTREATKRAVVAARGPDGKLSVYPGQSVAELGAYYQRDGVEGRAMKGSGGGTQWFPFCACVKCWVLTESANKPIARSCPTNERCTTVTNGVRCKAGRAAGDICVQCYLRAHHPPCPRCAGPSAKRTQCGNCDQKDAVVAKKAVHESALLALIAAGARDGRNVHASKAEAGVVYVVHNPQDEQRAQLVARIGNTWASACTHRDGHSFCANQAKRSNDGSWTHCITHGGGMRCESDAHDLDEGAAPYARYKVTAACTQVPLRGKRVCMACLRHVDPENIKVKVYVKKEDLILSGVGECLVELGRGELCVGRKARMVQDCATGASRRRMDADVPMPTDLVLCDVENDEYQHDREEQSCENRKLAGHYIDKGAPQQAGASSSTPVPKLYVLRFNCDGYTDDQGKRHPSLFNRTGVQAEDELLKLEPVNPRFKAACMLLARAIVGLHDNCTRPEFVDALKEWTVVYLRYDGCRADGTDPGGVAQAVAERVVGGKAKARVEAYKKHAKAKM